MIKLSFDEILSKLKQNSSLSEEEIKTKVDEKIKKLSGLVTKEGAAQIIANELGIKLFDTTGRLQIKNILSGMTNVEVTGKIAEIYDTRTFSTNGREGKVASITIADETGRIRIVLWNSQADNTLNMKKGDTVKVKGGYVRQRSNTNEIHVNERSKVTINPEGETINVDIEQRSKRKTLSELTEPENNTEVLATIVQVFEPRFFEICKCGKRIKITEAGATCSIHGQTSPEYSYVINAFLDDGTDTIRAVFFREQAQKLLNKKNQEILEYKDYPENFEAAKNEILGSSVKITGKTVKNEMFDRIELIANQVTLNPDLEPEIERLEAELKELRQN